MKFTLRLPSPGLTAALVLASVSAIFGAGDAPATRVEESDFGRLTNGVVVKRFTLRNANGVTLKVMSLGATITELRVPDRRGVFTNVVLGSESFEDYLKGFPGPASVIGRVANRIAKARFTVDGREYQMTPNNGPNLIHSGAANFAKAVWKGELVSAGPRAQAVRFSYFSPDGDGGFPGNLHVAVTYTLTDDNELRLDYEATSDKDTPVNLTNHGYFNLAGFGDVLGHVLWMAAERYTPANDQLIPTGEIASVKGTPLDFTTATPLGARIDKLKPQPGGYDHNYALNNDGKTPTLFARVTEPNSGRILEASTTEPGVQLYSANNLRNFTTAGGAAIVKYGGFCLETQHYPDSVNHPNFPTTILRPGQTLRSTTVFKFSAK